MADRSKSTALDMVRSLTVVGLAVVFLVVFTLREQPQYSVPSVDVSATVEAARKNVEFPVLALEPIPEGWRANAAYLEPMRAQDGRWSVHFGYVSPKEYYFGIDASNQPDIDAFAAGYQYGTDTGETRQVAGLTFRLYANSKQQVLIHKGVADVPYAIVITGSGDPEDFEQFTRLLTAGTPG